MLQLPSGLALSPSSMTGALRPAVTVVIRWVTLLCGTDDWPNLKAILQCTVTGEPALMLVTNALVNIDVNSTVRITNICTMPPSTLSFPLLCYCGRATFLPRVPCVRCIIAPLHAA